MRYTSRMDDLDKRIRRSAIKLVAVGVVIGFLVGFAVGVTVNYYTIERTVVIPLSQGIRT
jgi:ABC-type nitrate/sulfonate/bicarbonate transport system permease component